MRASNLGQSGGAKNRGCGICDKKGTTLIVEADWLPKAEYYSRTVNKGRDCGLVLAIKKPFGTTRDVKNDNSWRVQWFRN